MLIFFPIPDDIFFYYTKDHKIQASKATQGRAFSSQYSVPEYRLSAKTF